MTNPPGTPEAPVRWTGRLYRWAQTEPARVRIYGALVPVVGILVQRGLVTGSEVPLVEAALLALLGIGGVESARAKVVPLAKVVEAKAEAESAAPVTDEP